MRYARWRGTSGVFRCEGTAKGKGGLLRRPMTDAERRGSPDATVVSLLLPPHPGLRYHLIEFLFRTGNLYAMCKGTPNPLLAMRARGVACAVVPARLIPNGRTYSPMGCQCTRGRRGTGGWTAKGQIYRLYNIRLARRTPRPPDSPGTAAAATTTTSFSYHTHTNPLFHPQQRRLWIKSRYARHTKPHLFSKKEKKNKGKAGGVHTSPCRPRRLDDPIDIREI